MKLTAVALLLAAVASSGGATDPQDGSDCPFTLRIAGDLIPANKAPNQERYIISTKTLEHRQQLLDLVAVAVELEPSDTEGLTLLTTTMPLLFGNISRTALLWMCADPQAASCIEYIERDEQVSLA